MNKKIIFISLGAITLLLLGLVVPVFAQQNESPIQSAQDIVEFFENVLTWLATIFWIFAVGAAFYAGFLYLGAGGSPERTLKAKKQITYAVIAIIIGILAYGLPRLILNILGGGDNPV